MTMDVIPVIVNIAMKVLLINLTMHSQTTRNFASVCLRCGRMVGRRVNTKVPSTDVSNTHLKMFQSTPKSLTSQNKRQQKEAPTNHAAQIKT